MFADPESPSHAIFSPTQLLGELERKHVIDVAAGEEHTMAVAQIIRSGKPI